MAFTVTQAGSGKFTTAGYYDCGRSQPWQPGSETLAGGPAALTRGVTVTVLEPQRARGRRAESLTECHCLTDPGTDHTVSAAGCEL